MANPVALVTGASSGLGLAFAERLAAERHDLILVARRADKLDALATRLRAQHDVSVDVEPLDLVDRAARAGLVQRLASGELRVDMLVNNAGFGMIGPTASADPDSLTSMLELNCVALTELTRAVLPQLRQRGAGNIVNVASTAAFQPLPRMAAYAATKSYVLSFTQAVHAEVADSGVRVIALCPGPTETSFFQVAGDASALSGQRRTPEQCVDTCLTALSRGKAVVVDGTLNAIQARVVKLAPDRLVAAVTSRMFR